MAAEVKKDERWLKADLARSASGEEGGLVLKRVFGEREARRDGRWAFM